MPSQLSVSTGQYSDKGRKEVNQDYTSTFIPKDHLLTTKGVASVIADGISSSTVSQIASETAVLNFLDDFYCTSEALSVKKSALQVLTSINSWLFAQTRKSEFRYNKDKGYVCTLSAVVVKSQTAHLFHIGDSRIYRIRGNKVELCTKDHRRYVDKETSYLSKALGINDTAEIDYRALDLKQGDVFFLATDGVYEEVQESFIVDSINEYENDLNKAAKAIVNKAFDEGSTDNLTAQIIRVDSLPLVEANQHYQQLTELPFPPLLEARMTFDGYHIIREVYASSRSHVYLALDEQSQEQVIIKIPSVDLRDDPAYIERFLMEEWIARRINNPHVLKPCQQDRKRNYLYIVTEFIEGQTLTQWMVDNPEPSLTQVRDIVEQIAKGLQAFHRLEMLHQDLRPANIMLDKNGTVKIIDFGSTRVAGLAEIVGPIDHENNLGTAQYTAPEYFLGEVGTHLSDLFSLGVITYQMFSGDLPYGTNVAKTNTKSAQSKLYYQSVLNDDKAIPAWIDFAIKKAVHPNPYKRYEEISEFISDLKQPSSVFLNKTRPPLMERNPVGFWKGMSFILFVVIVYLLNKPS